MDKSSSELARLAAVDACDIMDTPRDPAFDQVVFTVAQLLRVPAVDFVIIGDDRIWAKAAVGRALQDLAWAEAVMRMIVMTDELLIIENAATDGRFAHTFKARDPQFKFCVATPLHGADHQVVGALCAFDYQGRTLTERQLGHLQQMARQGSELLQLRVFGLDLERTG